MEGSDEFSPPAHLVTCLAIKGGRKSKYVVKWALEKFVPQGIVYFKLLHVRPVISRVRNHMGKLVHISQVHDDVATAYRKQVERQVTEKLLPYKNMCNMRKVQVKIVQIESDDVANAVSGKIQELKIDKLVIGASSRGIFSRGPDLSSKISESCPATCTIYTVSEGKFLFRPSDSKINRSFSDDSSETSFSSDNSSTYMFGLHTELRDEGSTDRFFFSRSSSLPMQRHQALSNINQTLLHKIPPNGIIAPGNLSPGLVESNYEDVNETTSQASSFSSSSAYSPFWDQASTSHNSSENQVHGKFELENLRVKVRHIQGLHAMTQLQKYDASRKINELQKRHLQEEINLKEVSSKEGEAQRSAIEEKQRYEAAKREANLMKECAEYEASERKDMDIKVSRITKEKENLENALIGSYQRYRKFSWEEIVSATSSFSENRKIGSGACGTVYKCSFHHTTGAVKVLHVEEATGRKLFQQELEILSQIRHPHVLILLGACPENACLVYEFMANGNLEDRLLQKNNMPPLLWFDRYRIAWEIASALVFLHSSKPKAIIHRDLKPANILLDRHNVSKIGDVGLATMIQNNSLSISTKYKETSLVGSLCYIDPEYQRTGQASPKSDIYAFGMVILQLLTAKPAMGLPHMVETALKNDQLRDVLDADAGEWPIEETRDLTLMALKCIEYIGSNRPDLNNEILPTLEKLKEVAEKTRDLVFISSPPPPNHFRCPILKEVMYDPCVAADGHTYERKAIEAWLDEKDTSPITNLPLSHKILIPNYTILSEIMEWKSRKHLT
ncbi:U-box domain-containing protein 35-like [Henckelia pumila]|uniref:U-box domain-containing protein 35-like n=1 Tax=Henckelia pumila TaxID=405737 RepID=UPI003C6E4542